MVNKCKKSDYNSDFKTGIIFIKAVVLGGDILISLITTWNIQNIFFSNLSIVLQDR